MVGAALGAHEGGVGCSDGCGSVVGLRSQETKGVKSAFQERRRCGDMLAQGNALGRRWAVQRREPWAWSGEGKTDASWMGIVCSLALRHEGAALGRWRGGMVDAFGLQFTWQRWVAG